MCLSIAFLLIFTTFRRSLKKNPSEKSSWQLLSVFGTTCLGITFLLTFCWCSSQCQPLSIVVLQAVNKLRSQHWSKRANIISWYCTDLKKQATRHIWNSRFSFESISVRSGSTLLFGKHWLNNIPMQCCSKMVDTTLHRVFSHEHCLFAMGEHSASNFLIQCWPRQIQKKL